VTGDDANQSPAIELAPILEIADARALLDDLLLAVDGGGEVVVDAHAVLDIATPCLQVLLAAGLKLAERGQMLILKAPSDAFVAAMEDLGLFSALMSWNVVE
jgi:chemotaxis protein CheX